MTMRIVLSLALGFAITNVCQNVYGFQTASGKIEAKVQDKKQESKADEKEEKTFSFSRGRLEMKLPKSFKKVEPKFRMIDVEMSVPTEVKDQDNGRITIMGAGGSIDQNIERWEGQFAQADGSAAEAETTEKEVAEQKVTFVDIEGTYFHRPVPVRPDTIEKKDYRMLAAIIETEGMGNYFVKFYANKKTVDKHEKAFKAMIESLTIKK